MSHMYYIVGLGNPGEKYRNTRHNVGRDVVVAFAAAHGFPAWEISKYANARYVRGTVCGEDVELLLPETFMNKSGETVRYVSEKHDANPSEFIVVYDDVDLPLGSIKVSVGRGSGGHNGVQSIIDALGSKDFIRVRIGIAAKSFWTGKTRRPEAGAPMTKHVLGDFKKREEKELDEVGAKVSNALEVILAEGVEKAMNMYN